MFGFLNAHHPRQPANPLTELLSLLLHPLRESILHLSAEIKFCHNLVRLSISRLSRVY